MTAIKDFTWAKGLTFGIICFIVLAANIIVVTLPSSIPNMGLVNASWIMGEGILLLIFLFLSHGTNLNKRKLIAGAFIFTILAGFILSTINIVGYKDVGTASLQEIMQDWFYLTIFMAPGFVLLFMIFVTVLRNALDLDKFIYKLDRAALTCNLCGHTEYDLKARYCSSCSHTLQ